MNPNSLAQMVAALLISVIILVVVFGVLNLSGAI
jgi:hypothetical protein